MALRIFDVDDPFAELNPTMPDVNLVDADTLGPDNRPTPEEPWTDWDVTDANGKARLTFTVSMQPGNNYRAGASLIAAALTQPTKYEGQSVTPQQHADALNLNSLGGYWTGYSAPLTWSPMLTVWRKLHVETDAMLRPTFAENTVTTQWNQPRFVNGQLWVDILDQVNGDDFDNGYIRIQAPGFPDLISVIIDHDSSVGDDNIRTNISQTTWGSRPTDGPCIASDDDLSVEATFTAGVLGSDIGIGNPPTGYLPLPDSSGLAAHYQPAYILPVVESTFTSTTGIPFIKNFVPGNTASWDAARLFGRMTSVSVPGYWTAYVFSAFQPETGKDCDAEPLGTKGINTHSETVLGNTLSYSSFGPQYTGMCTVFVETLRDAYPDFQFPRTVAHEIAHTLGVDHGPGLMDAFDQQGSFSGQSLKELRSYTGP